MRISISLASALLLFALLVGCNLFNAPAMEVVFVQNSAYTIVQNSGTLKVPFTAGWNAFQVVNQSYRTITFIGSPPVQFSGSGAFSYTDGHGNDGQLASSVAENGTADFRIYFNYAGTASVTIPTDKGNFYLTLSSQ